MIDILATGNPLIWLGVAIFATALLAPRYLPMIGRMLGRWVGRELRRRVGFIIPDMPSVPPAPPGPRVIAVEVEEVRPAAVRREDPLPVVDAQLKHPRRSSPFVWVVGACVVAAGLFWWLLSGVNR